MAKRGRSKFKATDHRNDGEIQNLRPNRAARCRTQLARMRAAGGGIQVGAKMELRRQKDNPQQQGTNPQSVRVREHIFTKTELRLEWLRGQVTNAALRLELATRPLAYARSVLRYCRWLMRATKRMFARETMRRALAVLACAALLYFAAGGSLFHHHTSGPENACHICQSLHVPVLAAAALDLVATPQLIARYSSQPQRVASSDSFSLHRASRAPPALSA